MSIEIIGKTLVAGASAVGNSCVIKLKPANWQSTRHRATLNKGRPLLTVVGEIGPLLVILGKTFPGVASKL